MKEFLDYNKNNNTNSNIKDKSNRSHCLFVSNNEVKYEKQKSKRNSILKKDNYDTISSKSKIEQFFYSKDNSQIKTT